MFYDRKWQSLRKIPQVLLSFACACVCVCVNNMHDVEQPLNLSALTPETLGEEAAKRTH